MKSINHQIARAMRWCLEAIFWGGVALTVSLPWTFQYLCEYFYGAAAVGTRWYGFMLGTLLVSAPPALVILRQVVRVLRTINRGEPFVRENGSALYVMSGCAFFITAVYTVKCVFDFTFLTGVMAMAFLIFGFLALVFGDLFFTAARVKQENDLTI